MTFFFGTASSLTGLLPQINAFWPAQERIHIDAWREVNVVDSYQENNLKNSTTSN